MILLKVLLGHLDWRLGTKGRHSDPAEKDFLGPCIYGLPCFYVVKPFVENGVKTSVAGSCTILNGPGT